MKKDKTEKSCIQSGYLQEANVEGNFSSELII